MHTRNVAILLFDQVEVLDTTGGISAGIDGAFHVVVRLLGLEAARRTAAYMEYDWQTLANPAPAVATVHGPDVV